MPTNQRWKNDEDLPSAERGWTPRPSDPVRCASSMLAILVGKSGMRPDKHTVSIKMRDRRFTLGGIGGWHTEIDPRSGGLRPKRPLKGPLASDIERVLEPSRHLIEHLDFGQVEMDYVGRRITVFRIVHEIRPIDPLAKGGEEGVAPPG